jgi:hypothetical protein
MLLEGLGKLKRKQFTVIFLSKAALESLGCSTSKTDNVPGPSSAESAEMPIS